MLQRGLHATFVPAEVPRLANFALWPSPESFAKSVTLALPRNGEVVVTEVPAVLCPVGGVLDELLALGTEDEASRSLQAWATAARFAVGLVARGRIRPSVAAGVDAWRAGPLDPTDREARAALGEWMPPEAYGIVVGEHLPPRIAAPGPVLAAFCDSVADALPRTAAAATVVGRPPFATREAIELPGLAAIVGDDRERSVLGLRLRLPTGGEAPVVVELQLRSASDPTRVVDASEVWSGRLQGFGDHPEADLLLGLRRASRVWPALGRLLEESTPERLDLDDDDAPALLGPLAGQLAAVGVEVLVPASATRTLRASAHVAAPASDRSSTQRFDLAALCELTYRPTLDGTPLSDDELAALAEARRPVVRLRDEWVLVDPSVLAKLQRAHTITVGDALAAVLGHAGRIEDELVPVTASGALADLASRLRSATTPRALEPPAGLVAELRPYQRRGLGWLSEMAQLGLGGILADDMGLGKTIQLIALHLLRAEAAEERPTLVVCPASVVTNWEHELARFAPGLVVRRYHGAERTLADLERAAVVVTTYGVVRRDVPQLAAVGWGMVVADEAQHAKNPNAAISRALRAIPAAVRFALTGTPVENRLSELWALLDWTTPGLLGPLERFRRDFAIPIERMGDRDTIDRFRRLSAPFVLRRRKTDPDIAPDLPPKIETDQLVTLTPEQAGLYRAVVEESLKRIESTEGIARRGLVFKLLTALKQVCNHPAHYLGEAGPLARRSGKLDAFEELVTAIADAGDSVLVFTQYVQMAELLGRRLDELRVGHDLLHGGQSLAARTRTVERFQAGAFPVFVVSLKAGGTGLNLTRATHVVHYDRWWNPAVEAQASDRAWRIGQTRTVQVHRLISEGTIEERIATLLSEKAALADAVVGAGEAWISELSDEELAELVRLAES